MLRSFGYTVPPTYHFRPFAEFGFARCTVRVDIPPHPVRSDLAAFSVSLRGGSVSDSLDRVAHEALTEFCERHSQDTAGTHFALFPLRDDSDVTWTRRIAAVTDSTRPVYHEG